MAITLAGDLWCVVRDDNGKPIPPFDDSCHPTDDGMLVYRSKEAAECSAEHQADLYEIPCHAVPLNEAILA